jgi:hypothetical protein
MSSRRQQGKAEPRWGWSGFAPVAAVQLSASDIDLRALLPDHRSPIEEIVLALRDLGGRYQRYAHQDELGPTRAERMAVLRWLRNRLELLLSRLHGLPEDIRLRLSDQLALSAEPDIDNLQEYRSDVTAVQQICYHLQLMVNGEARKRLVVNLPPRTLKSFIVSVALPAWLTTRARSSLSCAQLPPMLAPNDLPFRNPEHRELFLSGLRLAAGETT